MESLPLGQMDTAGTCEPKSRAGRPGVQGLARSRCSVGGQIVNIYPAV